MPVTQGANRSSEPEVRRPDAAQVEYSDNRISVGLRFRVLPAVMVVQLTTVIATTVVAAAGPRIASDLGALSLYPWIFSAYTLGAAAAGPVVGKVSDLVGRRFFYVLGTTLFAVGSIGGSLAQGMPQLIAARGVAGIGGGAMAALLVGMTWANGDNGLTARELYAVAVTLVATALLLLQETRSRLPFISLAMFRRPVFTFAVAISFTLGIVFFAVIGYVPIYVQAVLGEGATASGALLIPMMAPYIVGGIGAGQIMARSPNYLALLTPASPPLL